MVEGRYTYKKPDQKLFLSYDTTGGFWKVNTDPSKKFTAWRVKSNAETPDRIKGKWEVWALKKGCTRKAWLTGPRVKVKAATEEEEDDEEEE